MAHRHDYIPKDELLSDYRRVFSSTGGRNVLSHMLFDLGVFVDMSNTPEDVALKNYGIHLLKILAGGDISQESMDAFLIKLMKQKGVSNGSE